MTEQRFPLEYSQQLVVSAVKAYFWSVVDWKSMLAFALLTVALIYNARFGHCDALFGAGFVVLFLGVLAVLVMYRMNINRVRSLQSQIIPGTSYVSIGPHGMLLESSLGSVKVSWSEISDIKKYPSFWLIRYKLGSFSSLPVEAIEQAALRAIEEGVIRAGGAVA